MPLTDQNVLALQLKMPEQVGWAMNVGAKSWHGQSIKSLLNCMHDNPVDQATLSVSFILPLDFEGGSKEYQSE